MLNVLEFSELSYEVTIEAASRLPVDFNIHKSSVEISERKTDECRWIYSQYELKWVHVWQGIAIGFF